ncbi:leucine-rich repeat domain-containing protein [Meridianimarinicoccus aquatilis]|uniref:Leucine-rich repeat domain-containing protein n=1 Tax=Meridianimarinicoccus aquatilis TaxID=2552766 RepID=A0A4R6AMD8_9RHOB|nr:leucine-rich repeat domain-containing protein [Fluviibacterium aquatile]TDL84595.1 leucine-rich repeat domain-containing protein [Fluviibacterium aquatile]
MSEDMWPFSKTKSNCETHPLIEQFSALMDNSKCLEWFENVAGGWNMGLPLDVAFDVQEAINLSYTITSMAGVSSTALVNAAKSGDYTAINKKMHRSSSALNERAADTSRNFSRIIEWANDHDLPQLQRWDATFYKQAGVPRNIRGLNNLRFLLVREDHGITEIPAEISKLPLLQGIAITSNKITSIPTEIYQCASLQRLDLEDNHITRVEDGIHGLAHTYAIDLSGNKLVHVTPDIARMPSLTKLDIRKQKTSIDMMRAIDTPLSDASLTALHTLVRSIDVKY